MAGREEGVELRIEGLETKLSYQEMTIAELGGQVYAQMRRLDALEHLVRQVGERIKENPALGLPPLPEGERPPHW